MELPNHDGTPSDAKRLLAQLDRMVTSGQVTKEEEATTNLDRIGHGEHPKGLRVRLRRLTRRQH